MVYLFIIILIKSFVQAANSKKGLHINVPTLVMHSENSTYEKSWSNKFFTGDAILNVKDINREAKIIIGNVKIISIANGLHDLILLPKPVREQVYNEFFSWLSFM